jgi:hypothetical protein
MIELAVNDPNSVSHEEFLLLQSAIGYQQALRLLKKSKQNKNVQQVNSATVEGKTKQSDRGILDSIKDGLEKLSGVDLSDVNVHKNSNKPQQVGALAYTQGKDIHIAPGQEKHLPHEGWHAVQQKQGRVVPSLQMKAGEYLNDDAELEKEADIKGSEALRTGNQNGIKQFKKIPSIKQESKVIQRITQEEAKNLSKLHTKQHPLRRNGKFEITHKVYTEESREETTLLNGIQTVLDIIGFIPAIGDIVDAINAGISILRKHWLEAVFSAIALIPVIGSIIAAPIKTIFKAGGKIGGIVKKAITVLTKLLGGSEKVVPKLTGILESLKRIVRRLPDLISSAAEINAVKWVAGQKGIKAIVSFAKKVRSGVETVCKKADEVFKSVKRVFTKETSKNRTDLARQLGKEGEDAAGIVNAKQRIPSLSGTAKYRIPDELLQDQKILREIKNVKSLSNTNQLKDFNAWAKQNGYQFILEVRAGAKLSGPLQEAIKKGEIILKNIGQ